MLGSSCIVDKKEKYTLHRGKIAEGGPRPFMQNRGLVMHSQEKEISEGPFQPSVSNSDLVASYDTGCKTVGILIPPRPSHREIKKKQFQNMNVTSIR